LLVNSFPLITQCSSMDQAVSLAARSRRFESSFYPCKVNLNTRRGEALRPHTHQPSPSIPRQQIRAHRLGVQCLTDPDCRRAVTALVPTITGMGDHVSGLVRGKVCCQVHSGTRLTDLPYFSARAFLRSNAWHTVPHLNPYSNFCLVDNQSPWIVVHRPSSLRYKNGYNQFLTSREC
jgi:hypothetical protein